jgi:hypothetical protein
MNGGMSPEEFQNYLGLLSRLLRLKDAERESIEEELRSHLEERLAVLTAQGIEPTRAVSMALAEFGDAAALAAEFTAISRIYKRRWIMRFSVGSIAASIVMAAVLVSYWPDGSGQSPLNLAHAQQAEKAGEIKATAVVDVSEKPDANAKTEEILKKNGEADFVDTPLEQVKIYFSDYCGVQFYLDRRALEAASISTDTPITFRMKGVPTETILRLMLKDIGLTYMLDDGVLVITSQEEMDANLETRFYRVSDLLQLTAPADGSMIKTMPETTDSRMRGSGPFGRGVMEDPAEKAARELKEDYAINVDNLIEVITTTIRPAAWERIGGSGSISEYRGVLVVSQTQDVHREIPKLLDKLRKMIDKSLPIVRSTSQRVNPSVPGGMGGGMYGGVGGGMGDQKTDRKTNTPTTSTKKD